MNVLPPPEYARVVSEVDALIRRCQDLPDEAKQAGFDPVPFLIGLRDNIRYAQRVVPHQRESLREVQHRVDRYLLGSGIECRQELVNQEGEGLRHEYDEDEDSRQDRQD